MMSLKNILTISRFEGKVLWRNWFFRIVAIAGVGFITIFNLAAFSEIDDPRWYGLSNSNVMPYAAMVMISIPQVAAVIFLATGLIKKDKKMDTNEVFFVRPLTNLDYVLGKALALFKLFFALNLVLLCIPLIVNLTSPYASLNPLAFVLYPVLTTVPSLIFTTGIAFLLVTLIRNQPVAIVLLLGLAGVEVIYYFDRLSYILDFKAFRLPMLGSEIGGYVGLEDALWQRSFYLITGIAFLFMTAFLMDRLSSKRKIHLITGLTGLLLLVSSSFIMKKLWDQRQEPVALRKDMIEVNGKWATTPNINITSNSIRLELNNGKIDASATMIVQNNEDTILSDIFFTLNPYLKVSQVLINNNKVDITRDLHIVSVQNGPKISPGDEAEVTIHYEGLINDDVAHLEVDQNRHENAFDYMMFSLHKKYAFLQPDYALLTRDVMWYPEALAGYNHKHSQPQHQSFTKFRLTVTVPDGLLPISQGQMESTNNTYEFTPEYPLPQISLTVGKYEKREIEVADVAYSFYHYPDNVYFSNQLDQLSDTLQYLIKDIVNEYEDAQQLSYPFKRLQFVETPLQFTAYNKIYQSHQAYLQPEIVLIPEEGGNIGQFDFRRQLNQMDRQAKSKNQVLTDKQKQANVFKDLVKKIFTRQIGANYTYDGHEEDEPNYSVFPNYYDYSSGIDSREWPLFNRNISTYLRIDKQAQRDISRNINGISFTEECNNLMREASLGEILTTAEFNKIQKAVSLKSNYLFSYLGQVIGEAELKAFIHEWINNHQHRLTSYNEFKNALESRFNFDLDPIIKKVYYDTSQAAFEILDIQKYEILDGDRKRYQVIMNIKNSGENDGVIEVKFNDDDIDNDNFWEQKIDEEVDAEDYGALAVIRQNEIKQLGYVLDEKPKNMTINTMISRNIPSVITMPIGVMKKREGGILFEGERVVSQQGTATQYEVIVDNEDPGFSTYSPIEPTFLKAYLDKQNASDKKYYGRWNRSYSKWLATTGSGYYGDVIRSAHFTRSGSGEKLVTWKPEFREEGFYDIYVYMKGKNQNEYSRNDNAQFNYHYIINHSDGEDNINYNISNAEPGWNFLGSYYFNKSGGSISLTDECGLRTVYADAIKWVKQ